MRAQTSSPRQVTRTEPRRTATEVSPCFELMSALSRSTASSTEVPPRKAKRVDAFSWYRTGMRWTVAPESGGDAAVPPVVESVLVTSDGLPLLLVSGGSAASPRVSSLGGPPVGTGMKKGPLLGVQAGEPSGVRY